MRMAAVDLWRRADPPLLASTSSTRVKLLESAGIPSVARDPGLDERAFEHSAIAPGAGPGAVAEALAIAKAMGVARRFPGRIVVGADQTLALEGVRFSKPASREQAARHLGRLSGKTHFLYSAVAVVIDEAVAFSTVAVAAMTMRALTREFIDAYLERAGASVLSSVGAYQVEGLGVQLFEKIDGDHSTILGLPLLPLLAFFRERGYLAA